MADTRFGKTQVLRFAGPAASVFGDLSMVGVSEHMRISGRRIWARVGQLDIGSRVVVDDLEGATCEGVVSEIDVRGTMTLAMDLDTFCDEPIAIRSEAWVKTRPTLRSRVEDDLSIDVSVTVIKQVGELADSGPIGFSAPQTAAAV